MAPRSNKTRVEYHEIFEPGWKPDVDPTTQLEKKEEESTVSELPHIRKGMKQDEVSEQYKGVNAKFKKIKKEEVKVTDLFGHGAFSAKNGPGHQKSIEEKDKDEDKLRSDEDDDDVQALTHMKGNAIKKQPQAPAPKRKRAPTGAAGGSDSVGGFLNEQGVMDTKFNDQRLMAAYQNPRPFKEMVDKIMLTQAEDEKCKWWPMKKPVCADYIMLANGKRRAGKTTLWKNVIQTFGWFFPRVYIFTKTKESGQFAGYGIDNAIFEGFDEAVVMEIMNNQKKRISRNVRCYEYWTQSKDDTALQYMRNPYTYLMFDDCIDQDMHDNQLVKDLGSMGRHKGLPAWLNTQKPNAMNTTLRENVDICYGFEMVNDKARKVIREEYMTFAGRKHCFDMVYDKYTAERNFIAIDLASVGEKREDCIYMGQADPKQTDPILLGSAEFRISIQKAT